MQRDEAKHKRTTFTLIAVALLAAVGGGAWWLSVGRSHGEDDELRPELIELPDGIYAMGRERGQPDERPAHQVRVHPFWMCTTEVSVAQYERVTGQRPNDPNYGAKDIHPVHNVSWEEAVGYLNELTRLENLARVRAGERPLTLCYDDQFTWDEACTGYRLPTEAEWEYAARAGTSTAWFFGEDVSKICDYANINDENVECDDGFRNLAPVETSELAPNPWGLYSMYGNVWEWTFDWYDPEFYGRSADGETINRSVGDERVLRGGSYWAPRIASSSTRAAHHPSSRDVSTGFRCARSTPAK